MVPTGTGGARMHKDDNVLELSINCFKHLQRYIR